MKDACIVIKLGYSGFLLGIVEWTVSIHYGPSMLSAQLHCSSATFIPTVNSSKPSGN